MALYRKHCRLQGHFADSFVNIAYGFDVVSYIFKSLQLTLLFCFIALTLTRSLRRCLNTWPIVLVYKWLLQDPENVII